VFERLLLDSADEVSMIKRPQPKVLLGLACLAGLLLIAGGVGAQSGGTPATPTDNDVLRSLYQADQIDRAPGAGKSIDWVLVGQRDHARETMVRQLYSDNQLKTGGDYYHAAMVLQHSTVPESFLLAHELSVVAISKGEARAKWLAAASEDRFLMAIGRPQRFGTQFRDHGPNTRMELYDVDPTVTDDLRSALSVPSLADAKRREAKMNQK
jgi:hypothetical protein